MSSTSKDHDGALSTLDGFIQALTIAKDACGILPAQAAFGAACALLTTIRVRSLLSRDDELPVYVYPGHHGQSRLCRAWAILRGCMPSPQPGIKREEFGQTPPISAGCHRTIHQVSYIWNSYTERLPYLWSNRRAMAVMRSKIIKQGKRSAVSRFLHRKVDKDQVAAWKQDLLRILHIFSVCSVDRFWHSLTSFLPDRIGTQYAGDGCRSPSRPGGSYPSTHIGKYDP